jgi:hypothetical protein
VNSFGINGYSVAAGATDNAVLPNTGSPQFFGVAGILTVYWNSQTVGLKAALGYLNGQTTIYLVPPGSGVSLASTPGAVKTNEDWVGQFPIPAGVQLVLSLVNGTGAAILFDGKFSVT